MKILQPLLLVNHQHEEPSFMSSPTTLSGPLPKSDSVQSLVSLINCPTGYPNSTTSSDLATVRGIDTDTNTHSVSLTSETTSISLSALSLTTVSLSALLDSSVSKSIREISLSANALEVVDISPLSSCTSLSVFTLNSNQITSIDLSALSKCSKLERLWLHDNRIESIDLSPLSSCKSLRSLYLEDNSLHSNTIDLSPLSQTQNLRSLRLGGNRLGGKIDLTPLLQCPALSVFQIDTSISLIADGQSSQARVSPALRRIVLDIKFTGKHVPNQSSIMKHRTTPPIASRGGTPPAARVRRKQSSTLSGIPPTAIKRVPIQDISTNQQQGKLSTKTISPVKIVKVLLVGFRRLARYAVEDAFSRTGKVEIHASDNSVASSNPQLILDSHLVILYSPNDKTLRDLTFVVGRIPTVVLATERYRSNADNKTKELLDLYKFFTDPISECDTKEVYEMGLKYLIEMNGDVQPSPVVTEQNPASAAPLMSSSPLSEDEDSIEQRPLYRRSFSESSLRNVLNPVGIEIEDIEDNDDESDSSFPRSVSQTFEPRANSCDGLNVTKQLANIGGGPGQTWSEVMRRLREQGQHRTGRGWGSYHNGELSVHGRNKLRTERAAVAAEFSDLGGYATAECCIGVARACGLPKCSSTVLFRAAYGSAFEIESTTPEAGVPNHPLERKRRISADSFLAYWDARLKNFDGEERLCNILVDSYHSQCTMAKRNSGYSDFGAPILKAKSTDFESTPISHMMNGHFQSGMMSSSMSDLLGVCPSDISCPCDAGIEELVSSFMEGRSARFGSFSLVKMAEAIAIGSALVIYGLRGQSNHRVGGHSRPVSPREVRTAKLNAALKAAEVGIFEGVAAGLSMDSIRAVKGMFATEAAPDAICRSGGIALNYSLRLEEVQRFCATRKTLLPGAVKILMAVHCRNPTEMSLAEFSVMLDVLNNISSDGAIDYFFTIIDADQDGRWTLPDLRQFHMEKEKLWLNDCMAISDLSNFWVNLIDMIRPKNAERGITRREFRKLGERERKHVVRSLLFVDDDHSLLNIRRTVELNQRSNDPVLIM